MAEYTKVFTKADLEALEAEDANEGRFHPSVRVNQLYSFFLHPAAVWWIYVGSHYACAAYRKTWLEKVTAWLKGVL